VIEQLELRRYDGDVAGRHRTTVEQIYTTSYVQAIASGEPFHSADAFMQRFDTYITHHGFDMLVAYLAGEPVGQTWGWPLAPDTGWWDGLLAPLPAELTREDGHRTFALSEIMVRDGLTGRGIAHKLHDNLLAGRPEERATLLVEPDNTTAYRAYLRWGWSKVGQLRPSWPDAPVWDVLLRPLDPREDDPCAA
jgi:hypothetical protein